MKNYKRILSFALALIIALAVIPTVAIAASDTILITLNGNPILSDVAPFIDANGRTMVPVRFIAEAFKTVTVKWDDATNTVSIFQEYAIITLQIGSRKLYRNERPITMDTEAVIVNGRTFVPVRFIAEALGMTVDWNEASNTVILTTGLAVTQFAPIAEYNGKVYSIFAAPEIPNPIGIKGSEKFSPLPEVIGKYMESRGMYIEGFAFYENKIYYSAAVPYGGAESGVIYRCNLDGSQNELLFNTTLNYSVYYPVGMIHYDGLLEYGDTAINLATMSREKVTWLAEESYSTKYTNGCTYFFSGDELKEHNNITDTVSTIMKLPTVYEWMSPSGDGAVLAVVKDTIYYATIGEDRNMYLYGISIYGGNSELLASWDRGYSM